MDTITVQLRRRLSTKEMAGLLGLDLDFVRRHFMNRLCNRAEVKPFGFHATRHLTASILYAEGQPVSAIQAVLRHQNPNTTCRYLGKPGLEETRAALDTLNTRGPSEGIEIKNHLKAGALGG